MKKEKAISKINPVFLKGIAHRGLHNEEFTENGMKAFQNAIDHGVAFEFDIHLTKDNELVVCHDENLIRTTGKDGIIEDLTLKEIKENYHLLDGGEIPTLQEVLDLNKEKVPMVIEMKVFRKNYKPLAAKTKEMLKQIKDKRNVLLISFDPRSLWPFKHEGFIRSLLVAKSDEYTWFFRRTVESVDLDLLLFEEKRVLRYIKKHFTNIWTIDSEEKLKKYAPLVDTVTYQFIDPKVVREELK
ncbi:MAG: glycerophosphodiester phosphodiesterase family protein [Bacilli bacterium]|nr:glycerophosphodiester phosphodiesterase family protein [Bacilli bacterium]